jgi:hypothetical protein
MQQRRPNAKRPPTDFSAAGASLDREYALPYLVKSSKSILYQIAFNHANVNHAVPQCSASCAAALLTAARNRYGLSPLAIPRSHS